MIRNGEEVGAWIGMITCLPRVALLESATHTHATKGWQQSCTKHHFMSFEQKCELNFSVVGSQSPREKLIIEDFLEPFKGDDNYELALARCEELCANGKHTSLRHYSIPQNEKFWVIELHENLPNRQKKCRVYKLDAQGEHDCREYLRKVCFLAVQLCCKLQEYESNRSSLLCILKLTSSDLKCRISDSEYKEEKEGRINVEAAAVFCSHGPKDWNVLEVEVSDPWELKNLSLTWPVQRTPVFQRLPSPLLYPIGSDLKGEKDRFFLGSVNEKEDLKFLYLQRGKLKSKVYDRHEDFEPVQLFQKIKREETDIRSIEPKLRNLFEQLLGVTRIQTIRGIPVFELLEHLHHYLDADVPVAIVGGAVRDILRGVDGREIKDLDIVVGCDYQELVNRIKEFFSKRNKALDDSCLLYKGKRERTGVVKLLKSEGDLDDLDICVFKGLSISTLKVMFPDFADEKEFAWDKHDYTFGVDFVWDSASRDFTFGSIYVDVVSGFIFDPCKCLSNSEPGRTINTAISMLGVSDVFVYHFFSRTTWLLPRDMGGLDEKFLEEYRNITFKNDFGAHFRFLKEFNKENVCSSHDTTFKYLTEIDKNAKQILNGSANVKPLAERWFSMFVFKFLFSERSRTLEDIQKCFTSVVLKLKSGLNQNQQVVRSFLRRLEKICQKIRNNELKIFSKLRDDIADDRMIWIAVCCFSSLQTWLEEHTPDPVEQDEKCVNLNERAGKTQNNAERHVVDEIDAENVVDEVDAENVVDEIDAENVVDEIDAERHVVDEIDAERHVVDEIDAEGKLVDEEWAEGGAEEAALLKRVEGMLAENNVVDAVVHLEVNQPSQKSYAEVWKDGQANQQFTSLNFSHTSVGQGKSKQKASRRSSKTHGNNKQ
eukprot:TRINITY_DN4558_c0_g1_i2.p1 TRINITY_DN4558_c0_g1~~TRINITY_DN4558_c0_g1_i2.p1  ORF type:complete len:882 (-),score=250.31 TRINITY_DN4558_c0_g1_i2:25-2670(-)